MPLSMDGSFAFRPFSIRVSALLLPASADQNGRACLDFRLILSLALLAMKTCAFRMSVTSEAAVRAGPFLCLALVAGALAPFAGIFTPFAGAFASVTGTDKVTQDTPKRSRRRLRNLNFMVRGQG